MLSSRLNCPRAIARPRKQDRRAIWVEVMAVAVVKFSFLLTCGRMIGGKATASCIDVSIRTFGDRPLLLLGATDLALGGQYRTGWEPPASNGSSYGCMAPIFSRML